MKLIKQSSNPATQEDLRILQETVIASSIASSLMVIHSINKSCISEKETTDFINETIKIISSLMLRIDFLDQEK